jgi:hypothetical protein
MKKVIYIAFVAVSLLTVSCSKENIAPNPNFGDGTSDVPVWRCGSEDDSTEEDTDESEDDGNITDPNNDRDESSRKKNH